MGAQRMKNKERTREGNDRSRACESHVKASRVLACAAQRRNSAISSYVPGRAAGSNASMDSSSNLRRDGTRADFSCWIGRALYC